MNRLVAVLSLCLALPSALAQDLKAKPLAPGSLAPPLTANHILAPSPEAQIDWPSLHGKTVVLEFWATWCVPCIAEIPVLNALHAAADPARVQFISITDEDPALIAKFLVKHPLDGTVAIDTSSKTFERYDVASRPATILVGPDGRIVSTDVHPETLTPSLLRDIADHKSAMPLDNALQAAFDPKAIALHDAILKEGLKGLAPDTTGTLFEISVTPGEPGDGHIMERGEGQYDLTNVDLKTLLDFAAHIPASRTTFPVALPATQYNLHVQAPGANPAQLAHAVELAILTAAHLHIERHTADADALVLTALPGAQSRFEPAPASGMAFYNPATKSLLCMHATAAEIGKALQKSLHKPIVDESNLTGTYSDSIPIDPTDVASANKALSQAGLVLAPARRPIETYTVTHTQ